MSLVTRRLALALVLLAAPTLADEPSVILKGPKVAPAGAAVMVDARESKCDADQSLVWAAVEPEDLVIGEFDQGSRKGVVGIFTAPTPGRYEVAVSAVGVVDKAVKVRTKVFVVVVGEGPTPMPPDPGPAPPPPGPMPDTPMARIAKDFSNGVLEAYAVGWETSATILASGQPAAASITAGEAKIRDLRLDAFKRSFLPVIGAVLPPGTEVKDSAQRDKIVATEREFAASLRALKR